MSYLTRTKQPRETKKSKLEQKDATFIYDPQNLRIRTSTTFFLSFRSREKCEETAQLAKGSGKCETRYPSGPIRDFEVKIILMEVPLDSFNFIDF